MHNKLNLKSRDDVRIIKLGDTQPLQNALGVIVGKSMGGLIDFYLVALVQPITVDGFLHEVVQMPEVCLERI